MFNALAHRILRFIDFLTRKSLQYHLWTLREGVIESFGPFSGFEWELWYVLMLCTILRNSYLYLLGYLSFGAIRLHFSHTASVYSSSSTILEINFINTDLLITCRHHAASEAYYRNEIFYFSILSAARFEELISSLWLRDSASPLFSSFREFGVETAFLKQHWWRNPDVL